MKFTFLVLSLVTAVLNMTDRPPVNGQSATIYYVYDGKSITRVQADPERVSADQWAAFYFRKGRPTSPPSSSWGMNLKKSPGEALRSVASNQKFERAYEKWCGCDWGPNTFFNVIAPVAMVKSASAFNPKQVELLSKAHTAWDEAEEALSRFNDAAELAGEQKLPKLLSGPFADFMKNMHQVLDQFMSISKQITGYSDAALAGLDNKLDSFTSTVEEMSRNSSNALQAFKGEAFKGAGSSSSNASGAFRYALKDPTGKVSYCAQTIVDRGNEITIENRFDNGDWTRHRILSAEVTASAPVDFEKQGQGEGWIVFLSCKDTTSRCVRFEAGDNYNAQKPDDEKNDTSEGVVFRTKEEATAFYNRIRTRRTGRR